jgi:phage shock protein PspC (stress-responsive transcriptional regulator)
VLLRCARNDGSGLAWNPVPSLIRFLVIVGVLVGLVYGGMIALVVMVKVHPREMSQTIEIPKAPK